MPHPYSKRDAVIRTKFYKTEDPSSILKIKKSVERAVVPVKTGIERVKYYHAVHFKESMGDLIVSEIFSIDLKGYLPPMWVNDPMAEECIERLLNTY